MNLIEQLGGYEQANNKLLKMDKILKEVYYSHSDAQKANELRQAILEYRRQHNIFEVGDYIILLSENTKKEWEFYQISEDDIGSHWINLMELRHATDDEIKVGHRI